MIVKVRHILTGEMVSKDIDVTDDQLAHWDSRELIQNAIPHLSADDREFLLTGMTPDEWDSMFAGL